MPKKPRVWTLDTKERHVIAQFLAQRGIRSEKRSYICSLYLDKLKEYAQMPLVDITGAKAKAWIDKMRNERIYAPKTIYEMYNIAFNFYGYLFELKFIEVNPFFLMEAPSRGNPRVEIEDVPSINEIELILEQARLSSARDYLIVLTILMTGVKTSELVNIRWNDFVITTSGEIGVKVGRGQKERILKVTDKLWKLFDMYRDSLGVDEEILIKPAFVFTSHQTAKTYADDPVKVKKLFVQSVDELFSRFCKKAGLDKDNYYTPKDFRHAHVVYAKKFGADNEVVQDKLGWASKDFLLSRYNVVLEAVPAISIKLEKFLDSFIEE